MKLRAKVDTTLKPSVDQSSKIKEKGMGDRFVAVKAGTELELLHSEAIEGHFYVVLKGKLDGWCDRGYFYAENVEFIKDNAPSAAPNSVVSKPAAPKYPAWNLSAGDFSCRIINYMMSKGYRIADGPQENNIVYLEGVNLDGKPNSDRLDEWNDLSTVIRFRNNAPYMPFKAVCTTEPGAHYTYNPMNPKGAFRIAFGQHLAAWEFGYHGYDDQPALRQVGMIKGHRDLNKDGSRAGDEIDIGDDFYVNQHGPYTSGNVGRSSAGCMVRESLDEHYKFMHLMTDSEDGDRRYLKDHAYRWDTTIIDGTDFAKSKWGYGM